MKSKIYKFSLFLLVGICFFLPLFAEKGNEEKEKSLKYFSSTSFSLVLARGNNQNFSFSFDTEQNLHFKKNKFGFKGRVIDISSNGEKKSEIYYSHLKYDREISSRVHLLGIFRFERNKLAGYNFRVAFSAGGGITWIKKEKAELSSELALGWNNENNEKKVDLDNADNSSSVWQKTISSSFLSSLLINRLVYHISSNAQLTFQETLFINLGDLKDTRLNTHSSVSATISRHFALQTSIQIIYENKPVPGFKNMDLFLLSSLVIKI